MVSKSKRDSSAFIFAWMPSKSTLPSAKVRRRNGLKPSAKFSSTLPRCSLTCRWSSAPRLSLAGSCFPGCPSHPARAQLPTEGILISVLGGHAAGCDECLVGGGEGSRVIPDDVLEV